MIVYMISNILYSYHHLLENKLLKDININYKNVFIFFMVLFIIITKVREYKKINKMKSYIYLMENIENEKNIYADYIKECMFLYWFVLYKNIPVDKIDTHVDSLDKALSYTKEYNQMVRKMSAIIKEQDEKNKSYKLRRSPRINKHE